MKIYKKTLAGVLSVAMVMSSIPALTTSAAKPTTNQATAAISTAALTVDGQKDAIYSKGTAITATYVPGTGNSDFAAKDGFSATTYSAYNGSTLYLLTEVVDSDIIKIANPANLSAAKAGERIKYNLDFDNTQDIMSGNSAIHGLNLNTVLSDSNEYQFYWNDGDASQNITALNDGITYANKMTANGYNVEVAIDTTKIVYSDGHQISMAPDRSIGLDVYVMDKQTGNNGRALFTWSGGNLSWDYPAYNGTLNLQGLPKITNVSVFNGEATINEPESKITVSTLKYSTNDLRITTADNAVATVSADKTKVTVTSADSSLTRDYNIVYTPKDEEIILADSTNIEDGSKGYYDAVTKTFSAEDNGGTRVYYHSDADLNQKGETVWNGNYTNLDPNRTYELTAYISFDLSNVSPNTPDKTLVCGLSPALHQIDAQGNDTETGWWNEKEQKYDGAWSVGLYNLYLNGGIYNLGQIKALQEQADTNGDGFVKISCLINKDIYQFDTKDMASLRIESRVEGLANVNTMKYMGDIKTDFVAPAGIKSAFRNFGLAVVSNTAKLDKVTVNNLPATIDETAKTVSVTLPVGSDANKATVVPTALENGTAVVNGDKITVTSADTKATSIYTLKITVAKPPVVKVTNVTATPTSKTLAIGGKVTLTANVKPTNATNKAVTFKSSDTKVATVTKDGKVTAKAAGKATITVTSADGSNKTAKVTIKVKPAKPTNLKVVKSGKKDIKVSFKKVAGANKYQILMKIGKKAYKKIGETTKTTYTVKKLKKGTKYSFVVKAYNKKAAIYGDASAPKSITR